MNCTERCSLSKKEDISHKAHIVTQFCLKLWRSKKKKFGQVWQFFSCSQCRNACTRRVTRKERRNGRAGDVIGERWTSDRANEWVTRDLAASRPAGRSVASRPIPRWGRRYRPTDRASERRIDFGGVAWRRSRDNRQSSYWRPCRALSDEIYLLAAVVCHSPLSQQQQQQQHHCLLLRRLSPPTPLPSVSDRRVWTNYHASLHAGRHKNAAGFGRRRQSVENDSARETMSWLVIVRFYLRRWHAVAAARGTNLKRYMQLVHACRTAEKLGENSKPELMG